MEQTINVGDGIVNPVWVNNLVGRCGEVIPDIWCAQVEGISKSEVGIRQLLCPIMGGAFIFQYEVAGVRKDRIHFVVNRLKSTSEVYHLVAQTGLQ